MRNRVTTRTAMHLESFGFNVEKVNRQKKMEFEKKKKNSERLKRRRQKVGKNWK